MAECGSVGVLPRCGHSSARRLCVGDVKGVLDDGSWSVMSVAHVARISRPSGTGEVPGIRPLSSGLPTTLVQFDVGFAPKDLGVGLTEVACLPCVICRAKRVGRGASQNSPVSPRIGGMRYSW